MAKSTGLTPDASGDNPFGNTPTSIPSSTPDPKNPDLNKKEGGFFLTEEEFNAAVQKQIQETIAKHLAAIPTSKANESVTKENAGMEQLVASMKELFNSLNNGDNAVKTRSYVDIEADFLKETGDLLDEPVTVFQVGFGPVFDYVKHGLARNAPYNTPLRFKRVSALMRNEQRVILSSIMIWSKKQLDFIRSHPKHINNMPEGGFQFFENSANNIYEKINTRDLLVVKFSRLVDSMNQSQIMSQAIQGGFNANTPIETMKQMLVTKMVDEEMSKVRVAEAADATTKRIFDAVELANKMKAGQA